MHPKAGCPKDSTRPCSKEMLDLSDKDFRRLLEESLGAAEASKLAEALSGAPSASLRTNPFKLPEPPFPIAGPVPWSPHGFLLAERPCFTDDPFFHAGAYYVQDSSAMFPGRLFRQCAGRKERPLRVLDLCAAPGGKTTDLAASLREAYGDSFILVANEVNGQRAGVLRDNVALWGDPNVAVTSADPAAFASLGGFFDVVVADVPCSGEGMFRKDSGAVADWSLQAVELCAARQRRIIADAFPALAEGGTLIYSTCTFNRMENDDNVQWIAGHLGAEVVKPEMPFPGILETECGYALLPGRVPGEGQYAAVLRKTASSGTFRLRPVRGGNESRHGGHAEWFSSKMSFRMRGDSLWAVPERIGMEIAALDFLRPISAGVRAGTVKGSVTVPSADLALSLAFAGDAFPSAELDRKTALDFLSRDAIVLPDAPKGYVAVTFEGLPLGFVKNLGTRCNNLHPAARRIRIRR